jgi:hypothetical protein
MTIFRKAPESRGASSWIRKDLATAFGRSVCDTKSVSANTYSLKSVTSQSRKSVEACEVENCSVDINLVAINGDGIHLRCRVPTVAIPNSLTSWAPGLEISCLDTSRSIHTKTTSEEGSKSLISRSPRPCSACCSPPSLAMGKTRFFCLRDAIKLTNFL